MTPLQQKQLEMLKIFTQLCGQLNLTYYLVCGSALGAVKYGGFIPWDDDVDVAMPREDYERFLSRGQDFLPEGFFLQNFRTDPAFPQIYSKLRNDNTTFIESSSRQLPIHHGIFIDIFPLDGYPEDPLQRRALEWKKRVYLQLLGASFAPPEGCLHKLGYAIKRLLGLHRHTARIAARYDRLLKQYPLEASSLWCNHGNWQGKREYALREQYGPGVWGSFEDLPVRLPSRWDAYLTQKYGDYTQDPPKAMQVSHHNVVICDPEKPYVHYIQ